MSFGKKIIVKNLSVCPQVTLTVDDQYKERWTSLGTFNMLASSQVFVGGAPDHLTLRSQRKGAFLHHKTDLPQNFIGCMRKVQSVQPQSIQIFLSFPY